MKVIIEALVAFGTFEVGEDIAIAPSFTACLISPGIIVQRADTPLANFTVH